MAKNIYMRFPGGLSKAFTMSYDDGVEQDARLIDIMKANGLKGTFNLNSGSFAPKGKVYPAGTIHRRMTEKQVLELYSESGNEIAVHGYEHPFLEQLPTGVAAYDIIKDREKLEEMFGTIVRGMAYPYGTYNDDVVNMLKACGIVYSRTVRETGKFTIPTDWMRLETTCHHTNPKLMEYASKFVSQNVTGTPLMFYLWGHSYEFESDNNWDVIEKFAEYIGSHNDIWYATNIEIYNYIQDYNRLSFSVNGKCVYNPSCRTIWFTTNKMTYEIGAGEILETN